MRGSVTRGFKHLSQAVRLAFILPWRKNLVSSPQVAARVFFPAIINDPVQVRKDPKYTMGLWCSVLHGIPQVKEILHV